MERLAELSNVSLQTIKDIEHAKRACQIDTFVSIAAALHLSADYLLDLPYDTAAQDQNEYEFLYHLYHTLDDKQKALLREIAKIMISLPQ